MGKKNKSLIKNHSNNSIETNNIKSANPNGNIGSKPISNNPNDNSHNQPSNQTNLNLNKPTKIIKK